MGLQRVGHDWEAELSCTLETIPKLFIKRESRWVMSNSLQPHGLYSPCNSPGQNTGVDSYSLLQGSSQPRDQTDLSCIFRQILYQPSHQGSPRILEKVAYPFSSEPSWPRNRTVVSCIAGGYYPPHPYQEKMQWAKVKRKKQKLESWASSRRWWWTGKPGVWKSLGSQRIRHELATELSWASLNYPEFLHFPQQLQWFLVPNLYKLWLENQKHFSKLLIDRRARTSFLARLCCQITTLFDLRKSPQSNI